MFIPKINPRRYDTRRKDPFRGFKRNERLYFPRPSVEVEEIDCCECVDGVDGYRDEQREPQISVCDVCEAGRRFEII